MGLQDEKRREFGIEGAIHTAYDMRGRTLLEDAVRNLSPQADELLALLQQSVEAKTLIHKFLDANPILAQIKLERPTQAGTDPSSFAFAQEPSPDLLECLAAVRAIFNKARIITNR